MENARRRSAAEPADIELTGTSTLVGRLPGWWISAAIFVAFLTVWEIGVHAGWFSALFFPAPSTIAGTLGKLFRNGEMLTNLKASFFRVVAGFLLGGIPGFLLGMSMGWSRRLRSVVDPFVAAVHPVPKIAILPLIMIIFGIGESSRVIVVAVAAFFPMLINTMAGVRQISPIYFDVAENYGAGLFKIFTRVVIPGSLPLVMAGVRLAVNIALLLTVAVELVAAREGLGSMIWFAWETLRTEELYASLTVIALLGISFNFFLQRLTLRLVPWQREKES
jgi:NitT/TauT family transport system permease protein